MEDELELMQGEFNQFVTSPPDPYSTDADLYYERSVQDAIATNDT